MKAAACPSGEPGALSPAAAAPVDRKSLPEHDMMLAIHVASWLRKRGKALRPKLSGEQQAQLAECFELMDADGSGAIDADELGAAFKLLGLNVRKAEIAQMLAEVDADGSGEVEYEEFIQIMTSTLAKLAERREQAGGGAGGAGNQVPFALLATAYRRKRIMEGLISGDREVTAQVVSIAEEASRRAAHDTAAAAAAAAVQQQAAADDAESQQGEAAATQAAAGGVAGGRARSPAGLLRVLRRVKSARALSLSGSGSSAGGSSAGGGADVEGLLQQVAGWLGDDEQAQLAALIRQRTRRRLASLAAAGAAAAAVPPGSSGSSSGGGGTACRTTGSSDGGTCQGEAAAAPAAAACASAASASAAAAAAVVVGASQRLTSRRVQQALTQELQLPRFCLSSSPGGGSSSRSRSVSPSHERVRSRSCTRSAAASPLPPALLLAGSCDSGSSAGEQSRQQQGRSSPTHHRSRSSQGLHQGLAAAPAATGAYCSDSTGLAAAGAGPRVISAPTSGSGCQIQLAADATTHEFVAAAPPGAGAVRSSGASNHARLAGKRSKSVSVLPLLGCSGSTAGGGAGGASQLACVGGGRPSLVASAAGGLRLAEPGRLWGGLGISAAGCGVAGSAGAGRHQC